MWKKSDPQQAVNPPSPPSVVERTRAVAPVPACIGRSLTIKGDLSGDEDLIIEGHIDGKVMLQSHSVTIGESGRVAADISAAHIRVAGVVTGDLTGSDEVVLLRTGRVEGNISAKSVTLENGARFKGSIDMETNGGPGSVPARHREGRVETEANVTGAKSATGKTPGKPALA